MLIEKIEIGYIASLTYLQINEKMNALGMQINQLNAQIELLNSNAIVHIEQMVVVEELIDFSRNATNLFSLEALEEIIDKLDNIKK
jgi:hypothetical protein